MTGGAAGKAGRIVLTRDGATLTVDPTAGGRFASLVVGGHEILVTDGDGPLWWGCYPMVPFAGRIRDGRFRFRGRTYQLPLTMPPNAIHGTVLERAWQVTFRRDDRVELESDLGADWPFRGRVTQAIALVPGGLEATLTVEATDPMPVVLGWHPWFRRQLVGAAAELDFEAHSMYARDPAGLPTGATIAPTPRPWDDAFTDLVIPPRLTWPGVLRLDLRSTAPFWVVFDEREEAICVEPQTGPPDAFNLAASVGVDPPMAMPDRPASVAMAWRWEDVAPRRPTSTGREGTRSRKAATGKPATPSKPPPTRRERSHP
ncbi:MAG: aldose 1-epimerase [Chloroflexota bacterium]